ncbi:MAG: HAD family hydrolase [Chloroflexota bacterium]
MTDTTDVLARLPPPGAIVLDLDGTLVDTVEARIEAWLATFEEAGIPATREQVAPLIGSDGKRLATEVASQAGQPIDDDRAEEIDSRSGELFDEVNRDPRPLPGAHELLELMDERGLPWTIATSSRRDQTKRSIAALELDREPNVVDGSHVRQAKPAPDLMLEAAQTLGVEPGRCWCVGDATFDVRSGGAAGMTTVAVLAGSVVSEADLRDAGASAVVDTLHTLVELVRR